MEKVVNDLQKGKDLNMEHYGKILEFIKGFADKCHHGKEEDILFPAMVSHGIPKESGAIAVMLSEHELGRAYIKSLNTAFDELKIGKKKSINDIIVNSTSYIDLLRNHIEKENNILFNTADQVLNEEEQSKMYDEFEKLEIEKIGIGKHEEYHQLLKELKAIYLT